MRSGLVLSTAMLLMLGSACGGETSATNTDQTADTIAEISMPTPSIGDRLTRPPEDDVIYFVLPDRFDNALPDNDTGGLEGGPLDHGFDPTHKGFYNGGDLVGLTQRLDYIKGMGVTGIWLGPIYKNKPVQGAPGQESAGYHGYWITDFTTVDPHFGTEEELRTFIETAHEKGLKVYLDIITNHTADVIAFRECHDPDYDGPDQVGPSCPYRSKGEFPYTTKGGVDGEPINDGFMGDGPDHQTRENFAKLTRHDYAYTPFVPDGEQDVKVPGWLNDVSYYHNRGETTFRGENSLYGDFAGLDDLFTAHPDVVDGFIDIYKDWITKYRIDGFRIDTARHVNPEFWQQFLPAVIDHANDLGIEHFYVFGEVYDPDPGALARFSRVDEFPLLLDFGFQAAMSDVVAGSAPTERLRAFFRADDLYEGGTATARRLPTFLGNHDMGRFALFVSQKNPGETEDQWLQRVILGHEMMFFLRGVPTIYYGDEQGFIGDGNDQAARETLFPSQVETYMDNPVLGTDKSSAEDSFDTNHPLYRAITEMATAYHGHTALRRGEQVLRLTDIDGPGGFAVSRFDPDTGTEYVIAANTSAEEKTIYIEVETTSMAWESVYKGCPTAAAAPGSLVITLPAFGSAVCKATDG